MRYLFLERGCTRARARMKKTARINVNNFASNGGNEVIEVCNVAPRNDISPREKCIPARWNTSGLKLFEDGGGTPDISKAYLNPVRRSLPPSPPLPLSRLKSVSLAFRSRVQRSRRSLDSTSNDR